MTFARGMIPVGDTRFIFMIIGAAVGILTGIFYGRFNVYNRINKHNNFTSETEVKVKSKSEIAGLFAGGIMCLAIGIGISVLPFVLEELKAGFGTILIMGLFFAGCGVLSLVGGIKEANKRKKY